MCSTLFSRKYSDERLSPVLKEALAKQTNEADIPTINFSDNFETAPILRLLLSIHDGSHSDAELPSRDTIRHCDNVLLFADKWNCRLIHELVMARLFRWAVWDVGKPTGYIKLCAFINAANYGGLDMACDLLLLVVGCWGSESAQRMCVKEDYWTYNPRSWPVEIIKRLPAEYTWALMTATERLGIKGPGSAARTAIATEFAALVKAWISASTK
jgi:hypothetical protein